MKKELCVSVFCGQWLKCRGRKGRTPSPHLQCMAQGVCSHLMSNYYNAEGSIRPLTVVR